MTWQLIGTFDIGDNHDVLVWDGTVCIGFRNDRKWWTRDAIDYAVVVTQPTHWQPLPNPPGHEATVGHVDMDKEDSE